MGREPFYDEIITLLTDTNVSKKELQRQKLLLVKKHGMKSIPSDTDILLRASLEEREQMQLLSKPMRTQAGVVPVAIMSAPFPCPHGKCTFCPDHLKEGIPMSYTGKEPASMRGLRWEWDAYFQVMNRLEQYVLNGHSVQKADVIVMGGTFPSYPLAYQESFCAGLYAALNDFGSEFFPGGVFAVDRFREFFELPGDKDDAERFARVKQRLTALKGRREHVLDDEQALNERAYCRCIGLTFETRPDCGLLPHGNLLLRFGGTRIELGVQSVYDECLEVTHRAHTASTNKRSIQVLRDLGFKLNFHLMPGLPGKDKQRILYEKDLAGMKMIFSDEAYRPDMIKLYPCMVMPGTELEQDFRNGVFSPMGTEEAVRLLDALLPVVPEYCRVMRVQRDIPTYRTTAGVDKTNLRQLVGEGKLREIRAREVKDQVIDEEHVKIVVREYAASGGKEFFISAEDVSQDLLLGFCRLRYPKECLREEISPGTAIIRELHVYGHATPLDEHGEVQHRGWGKKLLGKAEAIARRDGKEKMVVISGVGVREYYVAKHGYSLDGVYVSKVL